MDTDRLLRGAAAGVVAAAAMTALMVTAERIGMMRGQPPRKIVDRVAPPAGRRTRDVAALASHLAYGAAAGTVFAGATDERHDVTVLGLGFGLALWAAGYEGWVPAMGVLPPAHRDRRGRVGTMVAAHLLFGAVLARRLSPRR